MDWNPSIAFANLENSSASSFLAKLGKKKPVKNHVEGKKKTSEIEKTG